MLSLSMFLVGCVPSEEEPEPLPVPPPGIEVGSEGGIFTFDGVQLEVPEGALAEPVLIHIYDTGEPVPDGYDGVSTLWSFEPHGLVFEAPVTVTVPFSPPEAIGHLYWSNDDGGYDRVAAERVEGAVSAVVEHFSTVFVAVPEVEIVEIDDVETLYPPADVLFVVDNSCSMIEEQQALAANFPAFVDPLLATGIDVHIGVVSTDMSNPDHSGNLIAAAGVNHVSMSTPDPVDVFTEMVSLGTNGDFEEMGRAPAYTLIELNSTLPRNEGFYRPEATLSLVFVTDEEDQSRPNPVTRLQFLDWMATVKTHPTDVRAHGFFFIPGTSCPEGDTPGVLYDEYVTETGGVAASLCDDDWTPGLVDMVQPLLDSARVDLPEPAAPTSLRVTLDGIELAESDYRFEIATVFFDQGVRPAPGQALTVEYIPQ